MSPHARIPATLVTATDRGQILILTGLLLGILLGFTALVIDGGHGLLVKRQLQNASDAASLAAANVMRETSNKGCSPTLGIDDPHPSVRDAAVASVLANMPTYDPTQVIVRCPLGHNNIWVTVELRSVVPTFFGSILGSGTREAAAKATAVHGRGDGGQYNIILLNKGPGPGGSTDGSWPQARNGCPSLALNGGVSLTFEGSIQVNSQCLAAAGGAFATKGGSASLTMVNTANFRISGEYLPQSLTLNQPPLEHQAYIADPLIKVGVPAFKDQLLALPVVRTTKWVINGGTQVLYPGVYRGGIELRSQAVVYLNPGIYVMERGGFQVGAQATVRSVPYHTPGSIPTSTQASWPTDCVPNSCGVLIYKTNDVSGPGADPVSVSAGASVQLRAFNPDAPTESPGGYGAAWEPLRHLLFWQDAMPVASNSYAQPVVRLNGGGSVFMSGTIYAPSALIHMGGTSGGGGGPTIRLTLQFISWDLEFGGNSSFVFEYDSDTFVLPLEYGLVE